MFAPSCLRLAAIVVALAALTSGCGQDDDASSGPAFDVPAGVTLADPGTEKAVGESLTVAYPDDSASATALALTVASVTPAKDGDLALYSVTGADGAQPYYVRVSTVNRGPAVADFAGGSGWWLHVSGDTLVPPTTAPAGFAPCPPADVTAPLAAAQERSACLLFFAPAGTTVRTVDFQPGDVTTAVRWTLEQ